MAVKFIVPLVLPETLYNAGSGTLAPETNSGGDEGFRPQNTAQAGATSALVRAEPESSG
jgi:hypothetical protein